MTNPIEMAMYDISQFFLYPVLLAIAALFVHAFYALGAFAWQAWQRTQGKPAGFELHASAPRRPRLRPGGAGDRGRQTPGVCPHCHPRCTHAGAGGHHDSHGPGAQSPGRRGAARCLAQPDDCFFSPAVILALLAAAISFTVVNVRKRWYAVDLAAIEAELAGQAAPKRRPPPSCPWKSKRPPHECRPSPRPRSAHRAQRQLPKAPAAACWRTATRTTPSSRS